MFLILLLIICALNNLNLYNKKTPSTIISILQRRSNFRGSTLIRFNKPHLNLALVCYITVTGEPGEPYYKFKFQLQRALHIKSCLKRSQLPFLSVKIPLCYFPFSQFLILSVLINFIFLLYDKNIKSQHFFKFFPKVLTFKFNFSFSIMDIEIHQLYHELLLYQ